MRCYFVKGRRALTRTSVPPRQANRRSARERGEAFSLILALTSIDSKRFPYTDFRSGGFPFAVRNKPGRYRKDASRHRFNDDIMTRSVCVMFSTRAAPPRFARVSNRLTPSIERETIERVLKPVENLYSREGERSFFFTISKSSFCSSSRSVAERN